jgi:hypothetical protein
MRTRAKDVMRLAALIAGCVAPGVLVAREPSGCGCVRPRIDAAGCGDRAAVLGDVTGGCAGVLRGALPDLTVVRDVPEDLPRLPLPGVLPVSLGATPALPRLDGTDSVPRDLPGALPPIHAPARSLPGLPSIPVVRPVRAKEAGTGPVRAETRQPPVWPLGALALGGLLAVSSVIRRYRGQNVIYSDQ